MDKTYTFLFTDIEGSTQLWERNAQAMSAALAYHDRVMSQTIEAHHGRIFKTVGDGVCAVFDAAPDALQAALTIQHLLFQNSTQADASVVSLGVRMGLYTGPAEERANDYFGTTLNRASRLMSAAHGRQILLPAPTKELLPSEVELRDLGTHRLRDVNEPEHIFQVVSSKFPLNATPIRSLTPRPTNLPAQLTSFVGREEETADIGKLLRQANVRLLTLLGSGGIGKTRLSIQVGANLLDEYEDGVFFIPLAPLNEADAIIKFIAQALSVQEDASTPLLTSVKAHLQTRQILFVFDNFEHILDSAPLLNELLVMAPRVKILATSRESLFIYGERTFTVPPLDLPKPGEYAAEVQRSAAVKLFIERIQAMQPEFALSDDNAADVVKICRQLDGLPLALELAAARVRDLKLAEIAEQLGQRLALLSKGQRDLTARQQTMRGAIEWSYRLLSAEEQRAFARLAVFEGQFYAEAAKGITDAPDLTEFKSKSLVQQSSETVFSMLAVIKEYALERLAELGELTAMRLKHSAYYCQWLEAAQAELTGRNQIAWYDRLNVEQYNLQAAMEWCLHQSAIENAGRMIGILWRYWATQSQLSEGERWINQILAYADQLSPLIHARVTLGAGRLALLRQQYARATAFQQTSLSLFEAVGDVPNQAAVLLSLGQTEYAQGNQIQAENYLGVSLGLFRDTDDQAGIGRCLNYMGKIAMQNGDFVKAEPFLREGLALAREHGSPEGVGLALYDLAGVLRTQEKYAEAEGYYRESLALYRDLNYPVGVAVMLYNLGFTDQGQGNYAGAMEHFVEALKLLRSLEEDNQIAECLVGMAGALLHSGERSLCIKTLSAVKALLTSMHAERLVDYADQAQYERIYAAAQTDATHWQAAWDAGQATPLEQIIKEVIEAAQPGRMRLAS